MTRRTFFDLGLLLFFWGAAGACLAQSLDDIDMDDLSLREIDATIAEIERSLERITFDDEPSQLTTQTAPAQSNADTTPSAARLRGNPNCFASNPLGLLTPTDVDAQFEANETLLTLASQRIAAFEGLRGGQDTIACQGAAGSLLDEAAGNLDKISRLDLLDMAYHFEDCWPDDNFNESDGSDLNVDLRFKRARDAITLFGRARKRLSQARETCQ